MYKNEFQLFDLTFECRLSITVTGIKKLNKSPKTDAIYMENRWGGVNQPRSVNLGDFVVQNRGWPPYRNLQKPLFFQWFLKVSQRAERA